jgi:dihydrofolate reductase
MNVTLDGFMSGPDCELDWHFQSWNGEMAASAAEQLGQADTILLGRVTYMAMAAYWSSKIAGISVPREDIDFADMMNSHNKVVFSKTLSTVGWCNSRLVKDNIAGEIIRLKQLPGKDMIVYGSGRIVSALMRMNLVDEYRIWVHPVVLGKGKALFKGIPDHLDMKLYKAKTFSSGVIVLYYSVADKTLIYNHGYS